MNFNQADILDLAECFALDNGLISSEEELSELWDKEYKDSFLSVYDADDEIALNEEFSYFADAMCKSGQLHESQYNNYKYVGVLS